MPNWKEVLGYEGRYEVSDDGQVRSIQRYRRTKAGGVCLVKERVLKQSGMDRYPVVGLHNGNGECWIVPVHTLVLLSFIGSRPKGMQAGFKDGNPRNNCASNLRWVTPKETKEQARSFGRLSTGDKHWSRKATVKCPPICTPLSLLQAASFEDNEEKWKDIEHFVGLYQISNYGRIRRCAGRFDIINRWGTISTITIRERVLKVRIVGPLRKEGIGYFMVSLCRDGKPRYFYIHRLVAKAFVLNRKSKPEVNHKDGNKQNNCATNLEWVTRLEQVHHAIKSGFCRRISK